MFDAITTDELRRLARPAIGHQVSVLMPTHSSGPAKPQDPILLRQLLDEARTQLVDLGLRGPDADAFLAPATALVGDTAFWVGVGEGLAVYVNAEGERHFRLGHAPATRSVVADRFQLRPLLPAVSASDAFWVAALSQNEVRLLRGSRAAGLLRHDLGDGPTSLDAALRFDDRERQLQSHASSRVGSGGVAITMHGQGGVKDTTDEERRRFCSVVDELLRGVVGSSTDPMVLAGERRLLDDFRAATRFDQLVARDVVGNPDHMSDVELGEAAWEVVSEALEVQRSDDTAAFGAAVDHRATSLDETLLAAIDGKVAALIVPLGVARLGVLDRERRVVDDRVADASGVGVAGVGDLFDLVVAETLRHGGRVHAVDPASVPGPGPVAAILRY